MNTITQSRQRTTPSFIAGAAAALGLGAMMIGAGEAKMETEQSAPVQVGQQAPDFTLMDLEGNEHRLSEYTSQGHTVVLEWFNPTCPFVKKHYRDDTGTMLAIQKDMSKEQVVWLRVNSAKSSHPSASVDSNKEAAVDWDITTPILMDPTGATGKAYGAKRTPEMYIIDSSGVLTYHGAIDNRPDAAAPGDVNYVRNALTQTLAGEPVTESSTKAYGCSVKY
jgi:peroxiredoxin